MFLDENVAISSLVRGDLTDWEGDLDRVGYKSQKQLNDLAEGKLPNYLRKLYYDLKGRPE